MSFDPARRLPTRGWLHALTQELPREIAILRAAEVTRGFEPRRHAVDKRYRYTLLESRVRDPFLDARAWRQPERLDLEAMQRAAAPLIGEHDFRAYRSSADVREHTVRRLSELELRRDREDARLLHVDVRGDGFMHNMVRIIVGSLVDVGRGRLALEALAEALSSGERGRLGITAPPDGLCLMEARLDDEGRDPWPPDARRG